MDAHHAALNAGSLAAGAAPRRELLLLGQPTLREYLDFVRDEVIDGADADPRALCNEWLAANDYYAELERDEAGLADGAGCRDLDPELMPLAERLLADPRVRRAFDTLPTRVALVELDRLVVYQTRVTQDFVQDLQTRLGPGPDGEAPNGEALVRFCLPLEGRDTPMRVCKTGPRRYNFASASSDLRFHDAVLLNPDQLDDRAAFSAGAVGLVVGFGSNLLNVIRSEDDGRMLLHNGYHRACALRALGVTHAPCVVQTVTRRDELALAVPRRVLDAAAFYFKAARPPLLKDFFDPRIRKFMPVRRTKRVVEVSFEVREYDVED